MSLNIIDLLFPRRCPVCGGIVQPEGLLICPECVSKLSFVHEPICKICGKELISDRQETCEDCARHRRSFETGRALLNYNQAARASMTAIKYKNKREYLDFYGEVMSRRFEPFIQRIRPQALVPVPVHPARRRIRGFNQAEELARRMGVAWKIPVEGDLLIRTKNTAPQKELGAAGRLQNLQKAFAVPETARRGELPQRIVLVDDIYTTGSTIEACTRVLKASGVAEVYFLSVCTGYAR
ncbi:MAG: ComF family protein [Clostridiales bacterium]|nr:ComF family protein [Clostridiales bacterium]